MDFEQLLRDFLKEQAINNFGDLMGSIIPVIVFGIFALLIFKNLLRGVLKVIIGAKNSDAVDRVGEMGRYLTSRRNHEESVVDAAQRLLGDGQYNDAVKLLRKHAQDSSADPQIQALLNNAINWDVSTRKIKRTERSAQPVRQNQNQRRHRPNNRNQRKNSTRRHQLKNMLPDGQLEKLEQAVEKVKKISDPRNLSRADLAYLAKHGRLPEKRT